MRFVTGSCRLAGGSENLYYMRMPDFTWLYHIQKRSSQMEIASWLSLNPFNYFNSIINNIWEYLQIRTAVVIGNDEELWGITMTQGWCTRGESRMFCLPKESRVEYKYARTSAINIDQDPRSGRGARDEGSRIRRD